MTLLNYSNGSLTIKLKPIRINVTFFYATKIAIIKRGESGVKKQLMQKVTQSQN